MSEQALEQPTTLSETALELTQAPNSIFRRALFGGYKTQDVDHYVGRAADVLESLIEENKEYKVHLDTRHLAEVELRTALSSALNFTDHIVSAAKREASALLKNGREREEEYAASASSPSASLAQEIAALRNQRDRLAAELNASLDSHIRLLSAIETNTIPEIERAKVNSLLNAAD